MSKLRVAFFIRGLGSIAGSVRRKEFTRAEAVDAVNQLLDNLENVDFPTMTAIVDRIVGAAFREMSLAPVRWEVPAAVLDAHAKNHSDIKMDYEANWHASTFLMPEDEFRAAWLQRNGNVAEVATIFAVSEAIVRNRAEGLGLSHGHAHG